MKELCNKGIVMLLAVACAISLAVIRPMGNRDYPAAVAACAVPIPESKPGEEKQDALSATVGLGVLLVVVGGSLIFLQLKNKKTESGDVNK